MAQCVYCRAETELHESGKPVCVECAVAQGTNGKLSASHQRIYTLLYREVVAATQQADAASEMFHGILNDLPSKVPPPDGTERIHSASRELSAAREKMMLAHSRLNDFLSRGIIPEDLDQKGK